MVGKTRRIRLSSLIVAAAMLLSVTATAGAIEIPEDVIDAKDELATVEIAQVYNGSKRETATHNYSVDGNEVSITYEATLKMKDTMAYYLQARQSQLMDAKFNVHVEMDMDLLEFDESGDTLTVTFSSSFLKPWDVDDDDIRRYPEAFSDYKAGAYTSELVKYEDGLYYYEISVDKAWAQSYAEKHGYIDVPMELIVYYDEANNTAYSCEEVPSGAAKEKAMFYDFEVEDWMREIKVTCADLRVKDSVPSMITEDPATWMTVEAQGTIDGEFTYVRLYEVGSIGDYERLAAYATTLEFGNDFATNGSQILEEWTSNVVQVQLIRETSGKPVTPDKPAEPDQPDSPYLNLDDHFAYIIGMPDGLVYPEGNITRAEVATIFFRMLTDEVRNEYWSKTNSYFDVESTDWYNNAISTLTNLGIVNGFPDGGFHPTADITRAEFATMAVRFFIITEEYVWDEDAFSDIADNWANEYINLAYLLDIVHGYPDGTFRPGNAITRAEAMTIVNNTLRRSPVKEGLLPVEQMITWPDNMDTAAWFYEAVQEATNSHEFSYATSLTGEQWTAPLPVRDWAAFETEWSNANSAVNPGEVTGR